jgi:hypothetical protein
LIGGNSGKGRDFLAQYRERGFQAAAAGRDNGAGVVEAVDTEDLKSSGAQAPCGFESRPRHFSFAVNSLCRERERLALSKRPQGLRRKTVDYPRVRGQGRVAVWSSKYGKAKSFKVGGQLYVQFPVRPKT